MVFLSASAIRLAALVSRVPSSRPWIELPDADLPVYTILVPLFHEAAIVPDLVSALESLDYPRDRLDIKILLEEDDEETIAAFARADLPSHYCLMRLPDKGPRTKPKALCVGLALARGSLVCVFDAEDRPEPDQLRQAAGAFAIAPPQVCCLQARLAYANWNQSLLTRQFAIEYAALFDVMVPYITWARLPLPLGGTSNHFRTSILREAGGWDPYNVTEDADLGIRLARLGYEVGAIDSTTYEEAPATLGAWIKQRTRWMKGWMQTLIVHTRRPMQLFFQLGMIGSLGFVATVVANLVSAIVHPLALALLAWQGLSGEFLSAADMLGATVTAVASANLIFGYAIALACAAVGVYRRPMRGLALHLVATPVYWLLSAVALVLAVIDLIRRPHFWAKTEHGTARREAPAPLRAKRSAKKT